MLSFNQNPVLNFYSLFCTIFHQLLNNCDSGINEKLRKTSQPFGEIQKKIFMKINENLKNLEWSNKKEKPKAFFKT